MEMRQAWKLLFCAVLTVAAGLCLLATLGRIGALDAWVLPEGDFLLREKDGVVAVVDRRGESPRTTLTEIALTGLPSRDRLALAEGIFAKDEQELLSLLEDLGS